MVGDLLLGKSAPKIVIRVLSEETFFHSRHLRAARPDALVRSAQVTKDYVQLVHLTLPREQRTLEQELGENASHAPQVNGTRILLRA